MPAQHLGNVQKKGGKPVTASAKVKLILTITSIINTIKIASKVHSMCATKMV